MARKTTLAVIAAGIATLAGLASPHPAAAQSFSGFYVFGDSLSDSGTYRLLDPVRFTVNPGPVWNQVLGARYGIDVTPAMAIQLPFGPAEMIGGTNFAQGGACVNSGYDPTHCSLFPLNLLGETQQIAAYLALTGGRADPNALYSAWAGANDVFTQAARVGGGGITPQQGLDNLAAAAAQHLTNVATLSGAGARYIIVPNLPDFTKTPDGLNAGPAQRAFYEAAADIYNGTLTQGLRGLGGTNIVYVDTFRMLNEVIAAPAVYGLQDVTTPACTVPTSILCSNATLVAPGAENSHLFADSVHPTPAGHIILADYIGSILAAPQQTGLLAEAPIHIGRGVYRTLDARLRAGGEQPGFTVYGHGDVASTHIGATAASQAFRTDAAGGHFGLEYGFGNGLSAGAMLSYASGSQRLGGETGRHQADMLTGSVYATLRQGGAYAQVSGTFGSIDYGTVERKFRIGPALRVNSGTTDGDYVGARLAAGYDFQLGSVSVGPIAQLTYQRASVTAFSETQGNATAMSFGDQHRHLLYGTIGGRATSAVTFGGLLLRPHIQASFNYDFTDQSRTVVAGLVGAPVQFAMPVYRAGRSWTDLSLGAELAFNHALNATVSVGTQLGRDDAHAYYGQLGLSYRF